MQLTPAMLCVRRLMVLGCFTGYNSLSQPRYPFQVSKNENGCQICVSFFMPSVLADGVLQFFSATRHISIENVRR